MRLALVVMLLISMTAPVTLGQELIDGQFPIASNLRAGVAKVDITPEIVPGMKASGHVRAVSGVRDPLRAGVLLLDDGETKAAIVTTDLIKAWDHWSSRLGK